MAEEDPGLKTVAYGSPFESAEVEDAPLAPRVRLEVTSRLSEELARFGSPGDVRLDARQVILLHPAGARRAAVDDWLAHWDRLDEPTRRIRVTQLARSLARPTSLPVSRPAPPPTVSLSPWLLLGGVLALGAIGALWFLGDLDAAAHVPRALKGLGEKAQGADGQSAPADGGPAGAAPPADVSRASLVCAATRARIVRGATVSVADSEGWVVEYLAFRLGEQGPSPLHAAPVLRTFFEKPDAEAGSRYVWPEEPDLTTTPTSEDRVLVRKESISGASPPAHSGVRVTFEGALVDAYFRPTSRTAYFHLASALSDALGASQAALYARCADGDTHHLGSWFRGRDHHEAVVSLVYSLGTFADPPHLATPYLRPLGAPELDRAHAHAAISHVASAIDRPLVASLIGREGGMVMGRPGEVVTLTFPFEDGNRASRLSREIARITEIGGQ